MNKALRNIANSFFGTIDKLKDWLDLDFYVSLGRKGVMVDEMPSLDKKIRKIPPERLLVETDANPIMCPVNGPTEVIGIVKKIASVREESQEAIADYTTKNLKSILRI